VDACTIAVLDVIAAFAVPDPSGSSQSSPVFSGLAVRQVALPSESLSLLRTGYAFCCQPFQPSTEARLAEFEKTSTPENGATCAEVEL